MVTTTSRMRFSPTLAMFPLPGILLPAVLLASGVLIGASTGVALAAEPPDPFKDRLPRIPSTSPADALKTFTVAPGFRVEQVAAEPLVADPIAAAFDEQGRMFVVEMRGYSEDADQNLGVIRLLTDADADGRFEKSRVHVDNLSWPTAVICWDGGIFVAAAPDVWYCKDTTGDGRADLREKVFTGFGRSNVQGLLNSFRWGLDNRIHGQTSSSGGTVRNLKRPDAAAVSVRGRDFSFDPRTWDFRAESGGGQHGMCFDDWGNKFVCSNSNHIQMITREDRYVARNKFLAAPSAHVGIAADGPAATVYRTSDVEPWRIVRTELRVAGKVGGPIEGGGRPAGYFTGATGVTIQRGDAWPEKTRGQAIIGDVGGNLVHRKKLEPDGIGFRATRIDEKSEFVASSDIWFRPAQFANAPDGSLYVLDMNREVIEHPKSLPPMIKKHLDLTSGRTRGRIYRVVPNGFKQPPSRALHKASLEQLVETLSHPNGWSRDAAARLIYQRQDKDAVPLLRNAAAESKSPVGRVHALHALQGLGSLTGDVVTQALADDHPRVREHAVKLSETAALDDPAARAKLYSMTKDDDPRARYQLAFTLGEFNGPSATAALAEIARRDGNHPWVRLAILSSSAERSGDLFTLLTGDAAWR
ncbi:MAG: HEAT repeat domain-containing protein [Planctomycetales bacterium]